MTSLASELFQQIERTQAGEPWYGASRTAALQGVTFTAAALHPIANAPSLWELVLHMTAWTREVTRRLKGAAPAIPIEGDWPAVGKVSARAWGAAKRELAAAHAELLEAAQALTTAQLAKRVGAAHSPPLGTGTTNAGMLVGLAQHDAYHTGQLFTTRRALARKRRG